ncbi:MAG: hypothetical protein ACTSQJ_01605 [Promethearchaeota archaeon]
MCNNCNCDNYDKCSIVGFMPIGFCCSNCYLYDENYTCLKTKTKPKEKNILNNSAKTLIPISTKIEDGLLKVVLKQEDKEIPIIIDLQKHLE